MVVTKQKYDYRNYLGRRSDLPSMTVPDQTMSLREILNRHSRGMPITGNVSEPVYYDEDPIGSELESFKHMDLAEREQFLESKRNELKELRKSFAAAKKAEAQKAKDEADSRRKEAEELAAWKKAKEEAKGGTNVT